MLSTTSTESAFNELGVDAVTATELMDWLGLSTLDIGDPKRFHLFNDVIGYFKQFPVDTQRYLIKRATRDKNVDKLQHVWEYSQLLQKRTSAEQEMEKVRVEQSALGTDADPTIRISQAQKELEIKGRINDITSEIRLYDGV